jgi:D-alanyl-D-alanine dipeptidase
MKAQYYPELDKHELLEQGYVALQSSHTRGSTVDLGIVTLPLCAENPELDMGSHFDYFGPESWSDCTAITPQQRANRMLLRELMMRHGFMPFEKEWWHFTLKNEPFPDSYFNFPVM